MLQAYRDAKYGALTISNHDLYTDTESHPAGEGMVMVNGYEYSQAKHMLCINCKSAIFGNHRDTIRVCREQGGFVILCHPNWQAAKYWPLEDIDALTGYTGIEIYNGVIFRLNGSGLATDTWDYLLSQGKLVWGFGNDDFHRWHDLARVQTMIGVTERSKAGLLAGIERGSFYVTTGLILRVMTLSGNELTVKADAGVTYLQRYAYTLIGEGGEVLSAQEGESARFTIPEGHKYVRVHVNCEHGAMLWTQPVYRQEAFRRP